MAREASSNMISLKTADGKIFEVEPAIVKEMQSVQSFIDANPTIAVTTIPLPNVFSRELAKIIEYCRKHFLFRHANNGTSARDAKDFDANFAKDQSDDELKELILAANYLNIKDFLNFMGRTIAGRIQIESMEIVRKFFVMPEEGAKLQQENAWAFDDSDDDEE